MFIIDSDNSKIKMMCSKRAFIRFFYFAGEPKQDLNINNKKYFL